MRFSKSLWRGVAIFLVVLIIVFVWQWELINYGWMQGKGQFNVLWNARSVSEIMEDPTMPDSLKQRLLLVREMRDFAIDSLGLSKSDSYTTLYDQQGKDILWVVTASKPYDVEPKRWWFPIVGSVSYKGFFDYEKGVREKEELEKEGLDTYMRSVGAWSTLGWFRDPIMSNMLFRSEGDLANTVIHELTHATIFVPDSLEFNENLATFIGHIGAQRFLIHKYGQDSPQLKEYKLRHKGRQLFSEHLLRGMHKLDSLYDTFTEANLSEQEKKERKHAYIQKIIDKTDTLPVSNAAFYKEYLQSVEPNNAFFLSYERYRGGQDKLQELFQQKFGGNLTDFLNYLKSKYKK